MPRFDRCAIRRPNLVGCGLVSFPSSSLKCFSAQLRTPLGKLTAPSRPSAKFFILLPEVSESDHETNVFRIYCSLVNSVAVRRDTVSNFVARIQVGRRLLRCTFTPQTRSNSTAQSEKLLSLHPTVASSPQLSSHHRCDMTMASAV